MSPPSLTTGQATRSAPRLRHGFLGAALVVVAALRLAEGDLVWAAILGTAGLVETGLALAYRSTTSRPAAAAPAEPSRLPDAQVLGRSLTGHRRNQRIWLAILVLCVVAGASVVSAAPSVGLVLGLLTLVSLHQARRHRRSAASLERLQVRSLTHREGTA